MKTQDYKLEDSLGYIMGRAARSLGTRLNRNFIEAGYDVTCEQWSVLVNLWHKNGQTQQELAAMTCKDKTSMTRLIDGLEKRKIVVRTPDKIDRRQKHIVLTEKGKDFQQELLKIVKKTLSEAQADIDDKDLAVCKNVLGRVYENLSTEHKDI
jgi:MarR family transcriptional regulator, organic hydroperoxide resistance regulator